MTVNGATGLAGPGCGLPRPSAARAALARPHHARPRRPAAARARSCCPGPSAPWPSSRAGDVVEADITGPRLVHASHSRGGAGMTRNQGRDHRLGQHRHRPDDQGDAPVADASRWARWSASTRQSDGLAPRGAHGRRRPSRAASTACSPCRTSTTSASCSTRRPPARTSTTTRMLRRHAAYAMIDLTPAAIGPYVVPAGEPRRSTSTQPQRQHGDLRRPGDDPDGRRGLAGDPGALRARSSRRSRRSRPAPAPAPTSTSSPRPPRSRSRRSAAPRAARRSSSSTRPSRR